MASARKRGSKWTGLYRDGAGHQRSAGSYPTEKAALKAARVAEALGYSDEKADVAYPLKIRGKLTVAAYAMEWLPNHPLSPHARACYDGILKRNIIPALGGRVLADVTSADIRAWFRSLEATSSSQSLLSKCKTTASSMFQTAWEDGIITSNPVRGVKFKAAPPKRRRALTAGEWLRVQEHLTGEYRLLFDIIMATGARIEEVRGLEAEDIKDGEWHVCRVRNEVRRKFVTVDWTKTHKDRFIPVDPELADRIKAAGPGRVIGDFVRDSYRRAWRIACQKAGLDWMPAPRDARRSFATIARSGGADLEDVRVALGHARISTTDLYLGERPETTTHAQEAVRKALKDAA